MNGNNWVIPTELPNSIVDFLRAAIQDVAPDPLCDDSIYWKSHPNQTLSFNEAWQILRTRRVGVAWAPLVWN